MEWRGRRGSKEDEEDGTEEENMDGNAVDEDTAAEGLRAITYVWNVANKLPPISQCRNRLVDAWQWCWGMGPSTACRLPALGLITDGLWPRAQMILYKHALKTNSSNL